MISLSKAYKSFKNAKKVENVNWWACLTNDISLYRGHILLTRTLDAARYQPRQVEMGRIVVQCI